MNKDKLYSFIEIKNNACWLWKGGANKHGYVYVIFNNKSWSIHRLSYYFTNGEIPKNKWVLHKCDNRPCINPDHLYLGDNKQNVKDRVERKRSASGEKNGQSKLTDKDVHEIKLLLKKGINGAVISRIYKVVKSTIYKIKRNKSWNHIN